MGKTNYTFINAKGISANGVPPVPAGEPVTSLDDIDVSGGILVNGVPVYGTAPADLSIATRFGWLTTTALRLNGALVAGTGGGGTPIPSASVTIALLGSSTPERYFSDYTGTVVNNQVTYSTDGVTFQPLGTFGAGATVLGDEVQRATSKPVRFLKVAERGSRLSEWIAASSTQRAAAVAAIVAAADPNAIICTYVGGNDALAGAITSEASHLANYRQLLAQIRSETGYPNLRFLIWGINQIDPASTTSQKAQIAIARRVELQVAEDANCRMGVTAFDLALSNDFLHMAEASYPPHAKRVAGQVSAWVNGTAQMRGSRITNGVRVSDTQTRVTVQHVAGSDFTPTSGITGFVVGAGAISAVVRESATSILLTHAPSNNQTFSLSYADAGTPDISAALFDNSALVLPFEPTKAQLAVAGFVAADFLDTYTAADNTAFTTGRVSDSGHVVTVEQGSPIMDGGMLRGNGTSVITYAGFQAKTLTTSVRATLRCRTNVGSIWLAAKVVNGANQIFAGYRASASGWVISQRVGDVATDLGTASFTPVAGVSYVIEAQFVGDATAMTVRLLADGVEVISPKAITDASIRAALAVGARFATANTATTGWALDRLETL